MENTPNPEERDSSESSIELRDLKTSEIKEVKAQILESQGFRCAICGKPLTLEESVLDHQHKMRKSDENGPDGNGLVRGALCQGCNLAEGKITNALFRFLQIRTTKDRILFLQKLIEYYSKGTYPFVHPTEVKKEPQVSKKNFNKLNKLYSKETGKVLEYPKSKKLTKKLKVLFEKYNISPYN